MSTNTSTGASGTLDAVSTGSDASAPFRGYGSLWRGVPRELGFLLPSLPIVIAGLAVLSSLFFTGIGTVVIYIGFFLVLATLYVARGFGTLELVRLRWAGRGEIQGPRWRADGKPSGFLAATFGPFANGHYWLYLLHGLIISPIVGIATWTLTLAWVASGLGGVSYWIWGRFVPDHGFWLYQALGIGDPLLPHSGAHNPLVSDPIISFGAESVFQFTLSLVFLVTLPFVTRALTLLHRVIARGLLGGWRSEALQREVADLSASRGAALAAEDVSLRRLERDIHDGPQQRLIRLQMDLAAAERRLAAGETDAAADLLTQARGQAGDTLDELRALSRGFAPPILQDRGLVAALESLAARSTVPVVFERERAGAAVLPAEVERSAYFIAAELLTNVVKHSGASGATLRIDWQQASAGPRAGTLSVWVADNGHGGAVPRPDHGLSGLQERLRGLRGTLSIESPEGGPTVVGAHIPVERARHDAPVS